MGYYWFVLISSYTLQPTSALKPFNLKENYLLKYRLRWGQPDRLSMLKPYKGSIDDTATVDGPHSLPIPAVDYFRADTPPHLISIIVNDWPYSGMSGFPHLHFPTDVRMQFRPRSNTVSFGLVNQSSTRQLSHPRYPGV
jgi:hypothetical protein